MVQEQLQILLLEDDPTYAERVLRAFAGGACAALVEVATSLAAARARLAAHLPDLVIAEWALPDGGALDLLPASAALPSPPVLVLTNHTCLRSAVAAIKAGALDYLVKSEIDLADLPQIARGTICERLAKQPPADRSQRSQAEEALRESELLFQTLEWRVAEQTQELRAAEAHYLRIVETADEGIWMIDGDNKTTFVNQRLADMLGYSIAEMLGQPLFAFMDAESQAIAAANIERRRQGISGQHEFRFFRKDGTVLWTQIATNAITDGDGSYMGALAMITDITERRDMQAALEAERTSLTQRVEVRTAELRAANAELARAARLKDEFLASMSHELRTPLNTILGMTETMLERIYGPLNDEQAEALECVGDSGRHLLMLINDILDLSKIEAGRLVLDIAPIEIEEIIQSSLRQIKQPAQQKDLAVSFDHDRSVLTVAADPRRLKQMLDNLLSNAVKFTPDGGAIGLEVAGDLPQGIVRLAVWDTGIGIASADLEHLFQPFIQLDGGLSRQFRGTGLGLVLVERIAALHGGSVVAESTLGQGSRFTIALPWQGSNTDDRVPLDMPKHVELHPQRAQVVDAAREETSQPAASRPQILIADDNADNAWMFSKYLHMWGYDVVVALNGHEVLERAHELRPDLILMDIQMPGIGGLEATRHIRADAALAETPIIALTALAMSDDRDRCLAAGMNAYLSKPIHLQQLVAEIQALLGESRRPAMRAL